MTTEAPVIVELFMPLDEAECVLDLLGRQTAGDAISGSAYRRVREEIESAKENAGL